MFNKSSMSKPRPLGTTSRQTPELLPPLGLLQPSVSPQSSASRPTPDLRSKPARSRDSGEAGALPARSKNRQTILATAALVILACGGIAHGIITHRWMPNESVHLAVAAIQHIPSEIGSWTSEDIVLPETERQIGGIACYIQRTYRDRVTGTEVSLLLVTGESGPISVHPPTACFSGRGYHVVQEPGLTAIPHGIHKNESKAETTTQADLLAENSNNHLFREADFENNAIDDVALIRVYWGWSTDGHWQAPNNPRLHFASQPCLFKLYVSEQWVPNGNGDKDAGAALQFLKVALPVIQHHLNVASAAKESATQPVSPQNEA